MIFNFINRPTKKIHNTKLHISKDMMRFISSNSDVITPDQVLSVSNSCDICYVDVSDRQGYVKFVPASKYIQILEKYKIDNNKTSTWMNIMKNDFMRFYNEYDKKKEIDKSTQYMRVGRFIKHISDLGPYKVETFTIRYKNYQKPIQL